MKKKIVLLLALIMAFSAINIYGFAGVMDNFSKIHTYDSRFTDIKKDDWFYDEVVRAYEYGLTGGASDNSFNPEGNITIAEAITFVARIHSIYNYNTDEIKTAQGKWYDNYVEYGVKNGIITKTEFAGKYENKATRAEVAHLISKALPVSEVEAINDIYKIPDVSVNYKYYDSILLLCKAGVITGTDEYGTFKPYTYIRRSEVTAIIIRLVDTDSRVTYTVKEQDKNELTDEEIKDHNEEIKDAIEGLKEGE